MCIGDDTKAAARQSLNYIKNKKNKIWRKTIFNVPDGMECLHPAMWHDHDIDFVRWLWDDIPLNSPKRPPYWNSTSGFHFHTSPQSTCHSVPVCEILCKSDHPRQKKMTSCRFSRWRISAILDCRDPTMGSLKSPCTTCYRSSITTIALNCLVFENRFFLHFGDRQTDRQTNRRTNRWTAPMH